MKERGITVMEENKVIQESLKNTIGKCLRKKKDKDDLKKTWDNKHGKLQRGVFESSRVTDSDFNKFKELFKKMKESNKYSEYKRYFDEVCKLAMISPEGLIIQRYDFKKGKKDNNYVLITYSNTRQKIQIPAGSSLYHTTTNVNTTIHELIPAFHGKTARGYLYSTPRVYFTIKKDMPLMFADITQSQKTRMYKCKENIRVAYVDPLVPNFKFGAVYVETQFPIKVEEVKPVKKEVAKESSEDIEFEDINFVSLEEFCDYYGLIPCDDENLIEESFSAEIGKTIRKISDDNFIKKAWNNLAKTITKKKVEKKITEKEYAYLDSNYSVIKSSTNYNTYKKAYINICKFFDLVPELTSIQWIKFENDKNNKSVKIQYCTGKKKILIPNGTLLIHTSEAGDIKELIPTFCSKRKGFYMWPTKRVYFTLGKFLDDHRVGVHAQGNIKKYHYTPTETFHTAYIDSELPQYNLGAVYIDTQFPIKVIKIEKKK
jgi:hypothetical protein